MSIKLIHPHIATDPAFRSRFMAEAAMGRKVQHRGFVTTWDVLSEGAWLGTVMSLVVGEPLTNKVVPGGLPVADVVRLLTPIAEALDYLHGLGIVHRDLKPANIVVRPDGQPVVLDLGIAKDAAALESQTRTMTAMGTSAWMAPEQADAKHVDGAADRYALGMIAYVLLSGRLPWEEGTSEMRVMVSKLTGQLVPLAQVRAGLPGHVVAAVMKMVSVDAGARYATCGAFVGALKDDGGATRAAAAAQAKREAELRAKAEAKLEAEAKAIEASARLAEKERVKAASTLDVEANGFKTPHAHLRRVGDDLELDLPVSQATAIGSRQVDVLMPLGGTIRLTLPAGTHDGQRLRVRGKGVNGGDLYLVVRTDNDAGEPASTSTGASSALKRSPTVAVAARAAEAKRLAEPPKPAAPPALPIKSPVRPLYEGALHVPQPVARLGGLDYLESLVEEERNGKVSESKKLGHGKQRAPEKYSVAFDHEIEVKGSPGGPAGYFQSDGRRRESGIVDFSMVVIPPCTFTMGWSATKRDYTRERDCAHAVRLTRGFAIGRTPVTQALWTAVMGVNPSYFRKGSEAPQRPVERVNWFHAVRFCNALSGKLGLHPAYVIGAGAKPVVTCDFTAPGFRLPTEAEWECAARAGTAFRYSGSDDLSAVGWFGDNGACTTHAVGQKQPNAWGLYDMSGNVWEWCSDWYGDYAGSATDPVGAPDGHLLDGLDQKRVIRGGSWDFDSSCARVDERNHSGTSNATIRLGLRLTRTIP